MKTLGPILSLFPLACLLSGCIKPDEVFTIESPVEGVFYTVESVYGKGATDADFTRVYAHLNRNGKSDKKLVLDGEYIEISQIAWTGPHDVTLCMKPGFTDSFKNQVTLSAGDSSETINNHLNEQCNTATSNGS